MKTTRTLRFLALFGFLLLLAPFYDSCDGHRMKQAEASAEVAADSTTVEIDTVKIDSSKINEAETVTVTDSLSNDETPFLEEAFEFIDDEDSESAFEFAKVGFNGIAEFDYKEITKEIKKDGYGVVFFFVKNVCFVFIVVLTSIILVLSFSKKKNLVYRLSIANLVLLLMTILGVFFEGTFDHFHQIKWGYYAFVIVNILIFYYSKLALKTKKE